MTCPDEYTERDAAKVLRQVANRPHTGDLRHVLVCVYCGKKADYYQDEHAWDGWMISPYDECPTCIEAGMKPVSSQAEITLKEALAKFRETLMRILWEGATMKQKKQSFAGGGAAWPLIVILGAMAACGAYSLIMAVIQMGR